MGGKTTTTSGPSKAALPYLNSATTATQNAYNQSQGLADQSVGILQQNLPGVVDRTFSNPLLGAASGYTSDVLGGKYLTGNPLLSQQIANTNESVTNGVNSALGSRGLAGGSAASQILARELAKNETNLRYTDYNNERTRMDQAVGNAAGLNSADNQNLGTLLSYLTGMTQLPQGVANNYAGSIGSLWGNSKTETTNSNPGVLGVLGAGLSMANSAKTLGLFSDRRLKTDVRRIGTEPDGLGIYEYRYVWGGPMQRGVMADEVRELRPWALGVPYAGYDRVRYEAL